MLIVEILSADGEDAEKTVASTSDQANLEESNSLGYSPMEERTGSHAAAGPGNRFLSCSILDAFACLAENRFSSFPWIICTHA